MFKRVYIASIFAIIVSFAYAQLPKIEYKYTNEITPYEIERNQKLALAEEMTIYADLQKYKHLDEDTRLRLAKWIPHYATKYGIKTELLYSVLWRETRFQPNTTHKATYIKSLKKTVEAKGIGGVVCEFWCDSLKDAGIIRTESDLYNLNQGIEASAFILSKYQNMPKLKGYNLTESVLHRYYGKPKESYYKQIISKADDIRSLYFSIIASI